MLRRAARSRSLRLSLALACVAPPTALAAQQPGTGLDLERLTTLRWRNIGPNRGGRSLAIAGSTARPNEYYFGATGGGLWKTTDGGQTWGPVTDGQITSSSIGALAVAESNPDIVYIGGGEVALRGSITQGDGVYRSSDGGKTWTDLGLKDTQTISRIRVHATDPDLVYVAALGHPYGENEERGVFKSTDGGKTWRKVLYVSPKAGAADLIIDPSDPSTLYASTWQVYRKAWKMWGGGPHSGLWKSTDAGETWTELTRNPGMPAPPIGKIGITVSPADPNRLYAVVEANEGGVFRSDDAGRTWTRVNDERKLRQRHFYYSRIYADPKDVNTVYALNVGFWKSTDGGKTFDREIRTPHGDYHDLWIAPDDPRRMASANDGGGTISLNGGGTWTEQDYPTTQLYHVNTTSDFPYHVCGAQQDNSTVCVPSDDWSQMQARGPNHGWYYAVGGGESGYITQSPTDPDVFYAGSQGALLTRYNRRTGQIRDIQVYPRFFSGEPASALPERWQWTFPIVFSPIDPNVLFTSSQHVWKTTNDGQSWERISPDLTYADPETLGPTGGLITMDMNGPEIYATVFALTPSRHDVNTIWAGSDDGKLSITRDGGRTWQTITPPDLPKFSRISIIDESPHRPGTAYVAANRYQVDDRAPYVWKTHDYGRSWTKIVNGIAPGHFARAVRADPVRQGLLFLGTEHTVYVSIDDGARWQPLTLNLPDTPIRDLVVHGNDVVLGTHGRGFWILDDIQPLRELTAETMRAPLALFQPADGVRGVHDAVVQYWLGEPAETVTVEVLDARGRVVRTFQGKAEEKKEDPAQSEGESWFGRDAPPSPTTRAGLNRFSWDLLYPGATTFPGMIIWSARPQRGPKAPPGRYQVRVSANGVTQTRDLEVRMDPRVQGVTAADLQEQFELAMKIRDRESAANEAVLQIREIREQVDERVGAAENRRVTSTARAMMQRLTAIEEALYQTKNQSGQDPLNFPIRLNNRLSALRRSVETGDARPTAGAYRVLEELSAELDALLQRLERTRRTDLTRLNALLVAHKLEPVRVGEGSP